MNLCVSDLPENLQYQLKLQAKKEQLFLKELVVKALTLYLRSNKQGS
jgi:hypothetical protein